MSIRSVLWPTKRATSLSALALVLLAACSEDPHWLGVNAAQPLSPGDPGFDPTKLRYGLCREGADAELIDDMEDHDTSILFSEGRSGSWFSFNSKMGEQWPPDDGRPFTMSATDPPRGASQWAAHTYGTNGKDCKWGAGIGFELRSQSVYDASAYAGVVFWARIGAGATSNLRVELTDRHTSPFGGVCDPDANICNDPALTPAENVCLCDSPTPNQCHANFGSDLGQIAQELTENWQPFVRLWPALAQDSPMHAIQYGAILPSELFGIRFQVKPDPVFDFWVDDIAFLCAKR